MKKVYSFTTWRWRFAHSLEAAFILISGFMFKDLGDAVVEELKKNHYYDKNVMYLSKNLSHFLLLVLLDVVIVFIIEWFFHEIP